MSSNLDKSLDEIISSKPKRSSTTRRKVTSGSGVSKSSGRKKTSSSRKTSAPSAAPRLSPLDEASKLSDRIIISNLPTDVTEVAISDYFSQEVGPIISCKISYNAKGQSTGVVSITFKRPGDAHKASLRFNGTAIDNGAKRMKVELVMDPSKKPLSTRLNPLSTDTVQAAAKAAAASKSRKARSSKPAAGSAKAKSAKPKSVRRPKKTLEELDAEMEDYFDNKA